MTESEKSKYYVKINSEPVQQILQVTSIPTIFYFQYNDKFTFRGECHEAWEFSFVNNGEIEIINEGISHFVKPCQIYIHKPMSFHQGRSNGVRSSSFVISFLCDYKPLYDIADRVITLNKSEQDLVKYFYDFALATREKNITKCWFSNCIDNKITEFIGSEQVLKNIFEILLLSLLNNHRERQNNENDYNITQKTPNTSLITIVNNFIKKNIMKKNTIKYISNALQYSE